MARDDTPLDQETFDRVLADELAKGTDRRVAEGRARAAGVRAHRAKTGETPAPAAAPPAASDAAAAPASAPAAAAAAAP
ncbi:MAG: hypothetical protein WB297_16910, partial [Actinomycetota bacterium]